MNNTSTGPSRRTPNNTTPPDPFDIAVIVAAGWPLASVISVLLWGLFFATGCSAFVETDGPRLYCHVTHGPNQCLPSKDLPHALRVFSDTVMYIDTGEPLEVHWYDYDHSFTDVHNFPPDVVGYSEVDAYPQQIHVVNTEVFMHELTHIALERATGDPDPNHEEPPGAWGPAHNAAIEAASAQVPTHNGAVCPDEVCDEQ